MTPRTMSWEAGVRLGGLRRFAAAITLLTVLGHSFLGFEPSWAQPLAALTTTYSCELLLEWVDSRARGRRPAFLGRGWIDFLLPAHITGLAIAMLLYPGDRLRPVVFAGVIAIASKALFRVRLGSSRRHAFNPSNLGIVATLLCFPSVGIAPPYQFTEGLHGLGDWALPALIVLSGSFLNARFTRRLPLIGAWLVGFLVQAALRHGLLGSSFPAALMPMTGMAFLLFTFYMVTDPPTTPSGVRGQVVFGVGVALLYGLLMSLHVVFGLFFALGLACAVRYGVALVASWRNEPELVEFTLPQAVPSAVGSLREGTHARV